MKAPRAHEGALPFGGSTAALPRLVIQPRRRPAVAPVPHSSIAPSPQPRRLPPQVMPLVTVVQKGDPTHLPIHSQGQSKLLSALLAR